MELDKGIGNNFVSKPKNTIYSIEEEKYNSATNQLEAIINHVEAQQGKKPSDENADQLITAAE